MAMADHPANPDPDPEVRALLQRFVPASLREHAVAERRQARSGAAMLVDINGFSALTIKLAKLGKPGVEQLTERLRATFVSILDVVAAHNGEALQFLGDAVLAYFPDETLDHAHARALAAAHALLHSASSGWQHDDLSVRVGIGCGALQPISIGETRDTRDEAAHWLFHGAAVARASRAVALAAPGAWVSDPERAAHDVMATDAPVLRGVAPQLIRDRVAVGLGLPDPEFRKLCIAFVSLASASDPARALAALQTVVREWGVDIHQCAYDDKGVHALVAWGMPGQGSEADEERAVLAMMALRSTAGFQAVSWSAGVATGLCYVGIRGDQRLSDLAVVGPAVNLAAHFMHRLGPGIHCDQATYAAVSGVEFEARGRVDVKGLERSIAFYSPLAELRSAPRTPVPMRVIGRQAVCAALIEHATTADGATAARMALVTGSAGIGKSTALQEVAARLEAAGREVRWVRASAHGPKLPFAPWVRLLEQRLLAEPSARELAALSPELQPYAALLNDVIGSSFAGTDALSALEPEARATKLTLLLAHLLDRPGSVLVVDDVHELDGSSLELLSHLLDKRRHVVLAAARSDATHGLAPAVMSLMHSHGTLDLVLSPMD
jgi:class 3 adenylate cyclase